MVRTTFIVGLSLLLLAACETLPKNIKANESATPSLSQALQAVENNVREAALVTLSNFDVDAPPATIAQARKTLKEEVQDAQCIQAAANPLLPVISGAFSLSLQGAITKGSTTSASASIPLGLTGGYQYQISTNQQQQVTVPVTFVSALELGSFYFGEQASQLSDMKRGKATAIENLHCAMEDIDRVVEAQVNAYMKAKDGRVQVCKEVGKKHPIKPIAPQAEDIVG